MSYQVHDIDRTLPQRAQLDAQDIEAVEEIEPEVPVADGAFDVDAAIPVTKFVIPGPFCAMHTPCLPVTRE